MSYLNVGGVLFKKNVGEKYIKEIRILHNYVSNTKNETIINESKNGKVTFCNHKCVMCSVYERCLRYRFSTQIPSTDKPTVSTKVVEDHKEKFPEMWV